MNVIISASVVVIKRILAEMWIVREDYSRGETRLFYSSAGAWKQKLLPSP